MQTSLSTQSLLELLRLFEQSCQVVVGVDGQRLRGIPGWRLWGGTSLTKEQIGHWFTLIGYADHCVVPYRDDETEVDINEDEESDGFVYRCPETFRLRTVSAKRVGVYAFNTELFLHAIADLLAIPQALRAGIATPEIEGTLWYLGKARLGQVHTDIWVARGYAIYLQDIFAKLRQPNFPDLGVVLTGGNAVSRLIPPPRSYRFISLNTVLDHSCAEPRIDMERLQRLVGAGGEPGIENSVPVHFDEYTSTLTIKTNPRPWIIRGKRQAAAVRHMCSQAKKGRWALPAHEILDAAYADKPASRSRRIQDLFKSNSQWTAYIINPEKGKWGFAMV